MTMRDSAAVRERLDRLPRRRLAIEPTPLLVAGALRSALGPDAPRILLKMDAWTGFGLGGNKVRKLEHVLAPERVRGVTHLITTGGPQSNHARVTAAAAAFLGLHCTLIVNGRLDGEPRGNAYLHRFFGAHIVGVPDRPSREAALKIAAERVADEGGVPLVIPLGASTPLGALGYVRAAFELSDQLRAGPPLTRSAGHLYVFVACSSGGTLAGLRAGLELAGEDRVRLVAVSADVGEDEAQAVSLELADGAALLLGGAKLENRVDVTVDVGQIGDGYGRPTPASEAAAALFARRAGILLDQTYTAKAAAGLLHWIEDGSLGSDDTALFWHTGGWPAALP